MPDGSHFGLNEPELTLLNLGGSASELQYNTSVNCAAPVSPRRIGRHSECHSRAFESLPHIQRQSAR